MGKGDFRTSAPRFFPANLDNNLYLTYQLTTLAAKKGCTPAQLSLSFLIAQSTAPHPGAPVIPIPGSSKVSRVLENFKALDVVLNDKEVKEIRTACEGKAKDGDGDGDGAGWSVKGGRYPSKYEGFWSEDSPALEG